ncbi:MAG: DUF3631 domain-containing protein [Proteobacteria bacterium]|jgi:putative DNA primase/helicase|nr:DUF3631 domain-containing protein [Pseudomonadota bacterium]
MTPSKGLGALPEGAALEDLNSMDSDLNDEEESLQCLGPAQTRKDAIAGNRVGDDDTDIFAILKTLTQDDPEDVKRCALMEFASLLLKKKSIEFVMARDVAVRTLRKRGFGSPAETIDAAITRCQLERWAAEEKEEAERQAAEASVPVDGAKLLDDVAREIREHVILPAHSADAAALWVLHAHAHDAATHSPILVLRSPEKRSGKTTMLSLLGEIVPHRSSAANITPAALYTIVNYEHPTLLIDEADTFLAGEVMRGILNSGHDRRQAFVVRRSGADVTTYSTWSPKIVALIGDLADTLRDRSITVELRRKLPEEQVVRLGASDIALLHEQKGSAFFWVKQHLDALRTADPEIPGALHSRAADNWRPLIAIADLVGGSWPDRARTAAIMSVDSDDEGSVTEQLLMDIKEIFSDIVEARISSAELVGRLCQLDDRPWKESAFGRRLTPNLLASRLRAHRIRPKSIRFERGTLKGYEQSQFDDAFKRYVGNTASGAHTTGTPGPRGGDHVAIEIEVATEAKQVPVHEDRSPRLDESCPGVPAFVGRVGGDDDLQLFPAPNGVGLNPRD